MNTVGSNIETSQEYHLAAGQEDVEEARILLSKTLANDVTDPLFAKTGLKPWAEAELNRRLT